MSMSMILSLYTPRSEESCKRPILLSMVLISASNLKGENCVFILIAILQKILKLSNSTGFVEITLDFAIIAPTFFSISSNASLTLFSGLFILLPSKKMTSLYYILIIKIN